MAMERERQREVGARIKELRGRIPQPVIADRVGVSLRGYQEWEAGGGIKWENLGKLAEVLGVSEDYLVYGPEDERAIDGSQLDRIERKVNEILKRLGVDETKLDPADATEQLVTDLEDQAGKPAAAAQAATGSSARSASRRESGRARPRGKRTA